MRAAAPLTAGERIAHYGWPLTPPQRRRTDKKIRRFHRPDGDGMEWLTRGGKGRPTPRQRTRRPS